MPTRAGTRVMSCDAHVVVCAADRGTSAAVADRLVDRLHELERRWSRFVDDSEISVLNRAGGAAVRVHDDTVRLVEHLVRAWYATDGDFDPTLLGSLVRLGYEASRDDARHRTSLTAGVAPRGRPDEIGVDVAAGVVRLPTGTVLDPGGLGKGLAADLAVDAALRRVDGALVEIGGDLAVGGAPPDGDAWHVAVADPFDEGAVAEPVRLHRGGIATSSCRRRTWGPDRHHLLDPATLAPTGGDVVACTVIAGSAAWAEALTKIAFVRGSRPALDRYTELGLAARITTADRRHHRTPAWEAFR